MLNIQDLLVAATEENASDIHINVGLPPILRIYTDLVPTNLSPVTNNDLKDAVVAMVGQDRFNKLEEKRDLDFSTTSVANGHRFRVNAHYQRETLAMSFRVISDNIPPLESLHLPPIVEQLTELPRGMVLVTGHTGSGKSTTLASMIKIINARYKKRIITIEDPIEYMLKNDKCMIEQREIGSDCPEFASGLKHALRQDPDIIMVGEMRDLEATSSTITAAETGHLVFSTLHTINAYQTIERIIDIYPSGQQNQIRTMLANTIQAIISQTLFKRVDEPGMVPCVEILLCTPAVRNCIRENRLYEIPNIIDTSRKLGMLSMDSSIAEAYSKGFIEHDEAVARSVNPARMDKLLASMENFEIVQAPS